MFSRDIKHALMFTSPVYVCLSKFFLLLVSILRFTVVVLHIHIVILLSERVDRRVLL